MKAISLPLFSHSMQFFSLGGGGFLSCFHISSMVMYNINEMNREGSSLPKFTKSCFDFVRY